MTTDQAAESLRQSLTDGDKLMSSKTWSGGNFKSEAVRQVLAANEAARAMHDAIQAFLASLAAGTGPGGFDPTIARADLLASPQVQALADAADRWEAANRPDGV